MNTHCAARTHVKRQHFHVYQPLPGSTATFAADSTGAGPALHERAERVSGAVSCMVPCHNASDHLEALLPALREVLTSCAARWETPLVSDGNADATAAVLARWGQCPASSPEEKA